MIEPRHPDVSDSRISRPAVNLDSREAGRLGFGSPGFGRSLAGGGGAAPDDLGTGWTAAHVLAAGDVGRLDAEGVELARLRLPSRPGGRLFGVSGQGRWSAFLNAVPCRLVLAVWLLSLVTMLCARCLGSGRKSAALCKPRPVLSHRSPSHSSGSTRLA